MSQSGKTQAQQVAEGPELEKTRREVANYKRFRGLVQEIVELNERIFQARRAEGAHLPRRHRRTPGQMA